MDLHTGVIPHLSFPAIDKVDNVDNVLLNSFRLMTFEKMGFLKVVMMGAMNLAL